MMDWIRVDVSAPSHAKVVALADAFECDLDKALAILIRLWCWVGAVRECGDLTGFSARQISHAARIEVDGKTPGEIIDGFVSAGLLERDGDEIRVHDWLERNGKAARVLAQAAQRQARYRERQGMTLRDGRNVAVTGSNARVSLERDAAITRGVMTDETDETDNMHATACASAAAAAPTVEEVIGLWNAAAARSRLVKCRGGEKVRRLIRTRLKRAEWLEAYRSALSYVEGSDWTNGRSDKQWRADLEWMLRDGQAERYAGRQPDCAKGRSNPGLGQDDLARYGALEERS